MRTTLDIDDDVLQAVKELARKQHSTAGKVLSSLVRQALTGAGQAADAVAEEPAAYGFRPFSARGAIVSDEEVERIRNDESI